MDSNTDKKALRKQKKAERDRLTPEERALKSQQICEALLGSALCREARYVYCYAPIGSEADIRSLAEQFFASGKRVAFPRVTGEAVMEFFEVSGWSELKKGAFGVPEPPDDGRVSADWKGALVLVPGVAFAADGARCGYGKGYYDRYFAAHPELVRVGIGFECQIAPELSGLCEETDYWLDYVQTECRCFCAAQTWNYEQLVHTISGIRRFGRAPGIACSAAMMELLGHPERDLPFLHIAGTNGKGSVAAFLREICERAGVRAGLFTSPHLQEFTERIQIGHTQIPRGEVVRLGRRVLAENHRLMVSRGINLTMFDICLAIGLLYFKEQDVKLVILETGMGGRLDSTNMIPPPLVSVITGIGLEHVQYLGDTIPKIASEKAGILKHGTKAVLMGQQEDAIKVLTARCEELGISYRISGEVDAQGNYGGGHYEVGMPGTYQRKNAAAAIEAAKLLAEAGFPQITPEAVCGGIRDARWEGRMEVVCQKPWVLMDGAHNVHGVRELAKSLRDMGKMQRYIFFIGVMAEKDYEEMIALILPLAAHIYALSPDSERALPAQTLCDTVRGKGGSADVCADTGEAAALIRALPPDRKCVVCGSLYLIGEMRAALKDKA